MSLICGGRITPLIGQAQMCYLVTGEFQIHGLILVQIRGPHEERNLVTL